MKSNILVNFYVKKLKKLIAIMKIMNIKELNVKFANNLLLYI